MSTCFSKKNACHHGEKCTYWKVEANGRIHCFCKFLHKQNHFNLWRRKNKAAIPKTLAAPAPALAPIALPQAIENAEKVPFRNEMYYKSMPHAWRLSSYVNDGWPDLGIHLANIVMECCLVVDPRSMFPKMEKISMCQDCPLQRKSLLWILHNNCHLCSDKLDADMNVVAFYRYFDIEAENYGIVLCNECWKRHSKIITRYGWTMLNPDNLDDLIKFDFCQASMFTRVKVQGT
jgi:hypothetical protein